MKINFFYKILFFSSVIFFQNAFTFGIMGAAAREINQSKNLYGALVSSNGLVTPLDFASLEGRLYKASLNNLDLGLISGHQFTESANFLYAAHVSSSGAVTSLDLGSLEGILYGASINNSSLGLICGYQTLESSDFLYAAHVSSSGAVTSLGLGSLEGSLYGASINNSGLGLICGYQTVESSDFLYSAHVSSIGAVTSLDLGSLKGRLYEASINDSGLGLITGYQTPEATKLAYGALVSSSGAVTSLDLGILEGRVYGASINQSGLGLIGGYEVTESGNLPYGAIVSPSGVLNRLDLGSVKASIHGVSLNDSGLGLIAGYRLPGTTILLYAALVSPSGDITSLDFGDLKGNLSAASLNNSGSGLISGYKRVDSSLFIYAALVSPSGIVTPLDLGRLEVESTPYLYLDMLSVSLKSDNIDPRSFGSSNSVLQPVFAFSTAVLQSHLQNVEEILSQLETRSQKIKTAKLFQSSSELQFRENLLANTQIAAHYSKERKSRRAKNKDKNKPSYKFWSAPLGVFSNFKETSSFSSIQNAGTGMLLGLDYLNWNDMVFGGGFAYAYEAATLSNHLGHTHINQELCTLYWSGYSGLFSLQGSLWGGLYQMNNKRNILGSAEADSKTHGWILSPHIEGSYPFYISPKHALALEPFIMADWANNWQRPLKEEGEADLNLMIPAQYMSALRSEVGFYCLKSIPIGYQRNLELSVSLSYVNEVPFGFHKQVPVAYIGSSSTFFIQIFDNKVQNLGAVRGNLNYKPQKGPQLSLNYQGEFGAQLLSQVISFHMEMFF